MKGFLLDLNRCTGCHACMLACINENGLGAEKSWRQVFTYNVQRRAGVSRFHLSLGCLHCSEPACMRGCPASAYARDPATGAVLVDASRCLGCRYCSWICPFDAPRYDETEGTMSKCTFCNDRLQEGRPPACAALCPTGALQYAELQDAAGLAAVAGFPETGIGPAIRFAPLRSSGPELSAAPQPPAANRRSPAAEFASDSKINVESEWSLVFFTLAASLLTSIVAAGAVGAIAIHPADFLIVALGTMGVSAFHLGRWQRAWRAIINLRHSWLSREIAGYLAFVLLTAVWLFFPAGASLLGWAAALTGFGALFCIDRVCESASGNLWSKLHSARALLTGLFFFGVLTANAPVAGLTGFIKLVLYAYRQSWFQGKYRALASVLRLGFGFVAPLAMWRAYPGWILPCVLVAEVIDRCEYYLDLEVMTPSRKIAADLKKAIAQGQS
jgi:Fe-S-cluster-containing dehydrogenase component